MKTLYLVILTIAISSLNANDCIENAFKSFQNKEYNKAVSELKSCEKEILNIGSDKDIIKLYYGIGRSYLESGEIDSAFKYQLISYNLKNSLNEKANINLSFNDLGILYNKKGLPHKSIFYLNNAIKLNSKIGDKKLLFNNYINLGNTYKDLNFRDSTKKYYLLAKGLINIVDDEQKSIVFNNLAILYKLFEDYNKSIKYSKDAIAFSRGNELERLKSITNYQLTLINLDSSTEKNDFNIYLKKAKESGKQYFISDALFKLSILNYKNKTLSMSQLVESINLLNRLENYNGSLYNLRIYKEHLISRNSLSPNILSLENQLLVSNTERLAKEYGKEIIINQESELLINNLQKELFYSDIGFYGLLFIILFLISFITTSVYAINKYKLVNKLIVLFRNTNRHNIEGTKNAKSDLGKLTYMLDQRLQYEGNEQLFIILDKVINNVNSLDNIHISSSNKEAECQILQHQRITNG